MLAIPHLSQVSSMAEIDSKEAQKKSMAGIRALKSLTKETQERRAEDLALSINRRLYLKSKATEDIISIGSFMEVLVLNKYVLVRKILPLTDLLEHKCFDYHRGSSCLSELQKFIFEIQNYLQALINAIECVLEL
ncbi:hypothetical protein Tco_0681933 [Tanacetum coccineum]|uniref:Uncharacterized protein n=1 Tax=Tanacetum coccineum TaxID=301880 RepID=A0ABQ4XPQ5_9ASTR